MVKKTNLFCFVFLSLAVTQCGFVPRIKHKKKDTWTGPSGKVQYDVSALDTSLFANGNPIGSLVAELGHGQMAVCTAFAIGSDRIMTNHHCVSDEESEGLLKPEQITVLFRNSNDDEQTVAVITKIIDSDRHDGEGAYPVLYKTEAYTDWALLETSTDLTEFSPLSVQTTYVGQKFFEDQAEMVMPRINPPSSVNSSYVTKLAPVSAHATVTSLISDEFLAQHTKEIISTCKETAANAVAENDCNKKTFTKADALKLLEKNESYEIATKIRKGNSGSPLIYKGKVIGIAHIGIFSVYGNSLETTKGVAQFFHHVGKRLEQ